MRRETHSNFVRFRLPLQETTSRFMRFKQLVNTLAQLGITVTGYLEVGGRCPGSSISRAAMKMVRSFMLGLPEDAGM